jgi:3-phosphoshikimate 1-carboxyvinyltransferase
LSPSHIITPIPHPLSASVRVPGSKSLTNRALMIAALAEDETTLENALFSDDSRRFAESLQRLGFDITLDESAARMTVTGLGGRIPARSAELFVGNAGTAARFLTAMLTLGHGEYLVDGDSRMRERPIGDLTGALAQLGAVVLSSNQSLDFLPIRVLASGLPGGRARVAGNTSSQYLSGLLMAAPYAQNPVEVEVTHGLNSKPYVDMTLGVMADFGITVERQGYEVFGVRRGRYRTPGRYAIESDASAASYFFAAPAVCGGRVRVEGIARRSKQGDILFLDVLARMGCEILEGVDSIEVVAPPRLRGVSVDMRDISDTAQTLAAIAPFADSPTTIRGIASARVKETDRVAAMAAELTRLGVEVIEHPDGLTIQPCDHFCPAEVQTYNDHRMAMAFALIGLRVPGIAIENPGCAAKTFPNYFQTLDELRSTHYIR